MTRTRTLIRTGLAIGAAVPLLAACAIPGPELPGFIYLDTPSPLVMLPTTPGGPQVGVATVHLENHTDGPLSGPLVASASTNRTSWTATVDPASPCFAFTLPGAELADEAVCDLLVTVTVPAATLPNNLGSAQIEVTWGGVDDSESMPLQATL